MLCVSVSVCVCVDVVCVCMYVCVCVWMLFLFVCECVFVVPWWCSGRHGVLPFHRLVVQIPGVEGVCHFSHTSCCDNI